VDAEAVVICTERGSARRDVNLSGGFSCDLQIGWVIVIVDNVANREPWIASPWTEASRS